MEGQSRGERIAQTGVCSYHITQLRRRSTTSSVVEVETTLDDSRLSSIETRLQMKNILLLTS